MRFSLPEQTVVSGSGLMPGDDVDEEVREFLRANVRSYEQLEILLALRHAPRDWTLAELTRELHLSDTAAAYAIEALQRSGLIEARSAAGGGVRTFSYTATGNTPARVLDLVANDLRDRPATLLRVMSAQAVERVRTGAARAFADAFVLRKDKPDG